LHSHANRYEYLACEVLYIARDNSNRLIGPAASTAVLPGDELLLAGCLAARNAFSLNIGNEHTLTYVLTGDDSQRGWIWNKLTPKQVREETHHLP
jgi:hypothetical protein